MRYLPQTKENRAAMLKTIGVESVNDLFRDIPASAFVKGKVDLPDHQGELDIERQMAAYANENKPASSGPFFLGAGCYYHHIPATVDYIIQRSEFLTAYTPYQPEIAQGTLKAIYEYQSFIALLTGQDVANASLYDGATAMAEAALMAMRVTKRTNIVYGSEIHPHYKDVLQTYLTHNGTGKVIDAVRPVDTSRSDGVAQDGHIKLDDALLKDAACIIVQSPDFFGNVHAYDAFRKQCDETGALLVVVINEIVSLGLLPAPTQADIVCGEAQSIGLPMSFGGPHLGFFACKEKYIRQMPGRLCGETVDAQGRKGYVLTLSTREQHIRREKATSNICTNQGLCALAFTVHMALLGEDGFKTLARLNHERAQALEEELEKIKGVSIINDTYFNEFVIQLPKDTDSTALVEQLASQGLSAGYALDHGRILVAATEMTTDADLRALRESLERALSC
jgi:glycine dehydrogenase subunit 1